MTSYDALYKLQTDPTDKVAVIDQEAIVYANEKMDSDAETTYKRAISEFPNVLSAHTAYGEYLSGEERQRRRGTRVHRGRRAEPRSGRCDRQARPALRCAEPNPEGDRSVQARERAGAERSSLALAARRDVLGEQTVRQGRRRVQGILRPAAHARCADGSGPSRPADAQLYRVRAGLRRARQGCAGPRAAESRRSSTGSASATRVRKQPDKAKARTKSC